MDNLKNSYFRVLLLVLGFVIGFNAALSAQNNPARIMARFAHPQFDANAKTYSLDMEMHAESAAEQLFGLNLRFFYDASNLEFTHISDLPEHYFIQGNVPKAYLGNETSGSALFDMSAAAAYVNTAVQLAEGSTPKEISNKYWTRIGKIHFTVRALEAQAEDFCPTVLWDQKPGTRQQGFLPGSNGITLVLMENDPGTKVSTKPAVVAVQPFNWKEGDEAMPYGYPVKTSCVPVSFSTTVAGGLETPGYSLYQNYPNPFADQTAIEFVLPKAQEARLVFTDVTGKIVHSVQGQYTAGRHSIVVDRQVWPIQGAMVFYHLETEEFRSGALKMTLKDR